MFDLKGKTALVTGSSRGIGRAILLAYARQGADVILHCRKPDARAEETLALARETGVKVYSVFGDLSQKDAPAGVSGGRRRFGRFFISRRGALRGADMGACSPGASRYLSFLVSGIALGLRFVYMWF